MTYPALFIKALQNSLEANADQDSALGHFIEALQDVTPVSTGCVWDDLKHPLLSQLDDALNAALGPPELVESVAALSSAGGWYQVYTGDGINAAMANFMLAKQIVGPKGHFGSNSMRAGIFLLAPHFEYLMHAHAALEIYYVHSGSIDIQNGTESAQRRLGPGQYSITPSELPHALHTGDAPVLLLFVWTGNVTAPIWWWVKGEDGNWTRTLAKKPRCRSMLQSTDRRKPAFTLPDKQHGNPQRATPRTMPGHDPLRTDMHQAPGWYAMLPPPAPANRLKGEQNADWVVVGAGVTGLAAARRLAELAPEARIILLEEYRVGYGASGRNSGFIIDTPHLTEGFDAAYNQRVSRVVLAGHAELERLVHEHGIECEWSPRGHLHAIVESKWVGKLESTCRTLDTVDEEYEWLEGDALANVLGTRHYHAAVYTPRTVLMNPAALCRGLGKTMPENVEVFEESPVRRVDPGSPVRIDCAEGSISAGNVLLTTNAFITALGFLRRELFPMIACCSLSRPLTEDEQAAMSGEPEWGITPAVSTGPTVRRTLSNRIVFRHGARYTGEFRLSDGMRRNLRSRHEEGVRRRFPMLANLEMEHTWAGVFCRTRNWASIFGRLESGVFASLGYAGIGVPRGTISGKLLAEFALGAESDLIRDVQAFSGPKRLPPEPLLGLGVTARHWWLRQRARAER